MFDLQILIQTNKRVVEHNFLKTVLILINKNLKILQYMLIPILVFDVALVAWSLHLIEKAVQSKEFSLLLAGTLVAVAAAAMLVVYFLMGHCMSYLLKM